MVFTGEDEGELLGYLAHALAMPAIGSRPCSRSARSPWLHTGQETGVLQKEGRLPLVFLLSLFLTGILTSGQEVIKTFLDLQARSHLSLSTAQRS